MHRASLARLHMGIKMRLSRFISYLFLTYFIQRRITRILRAWKVKAMQIVLANMRTGHYIESGPIKVRAMQIVFANMRTGHYIESGPMWEYMYARATSHRPIQKMAAWAISSTYICMQTLLALYVFLGVGAACYRQLVGRYLACKLIQGVAESVSGRNSSMLYS